MTADKAELQFLALLVHRGHVPRSEAEELLTDLQGGSPLDELLVERLGWSDEKVRQMRRTRAGEIPEIPGYEILGRTGTGGTADVFRARDKKQNKVLALKVLNRPSTLNQGVRRAFVTEGRLLEKLSHPNLVRGLGVARSGEVYFSRLEFIDGQTLLELLDAGQPFPEESALRIVLEAARALAYLEEERIVHRDIKPGNIMLTSSGRVKLIDLGFAAETDESGGAESSVGTVAYLSPEQARGGASADARSDIYSLGVSLFHLVVGRLPFESSDDREVLRMQIMESLSSPELKGRNISPHLHYFIEKMMAKEADHRYQSWSELIKDIEEQLEGRESLDFTTSPQRSRRGRPRA